MNDAANFADYLNTAESLAQRVTDEQDRQLLAADLAQLRSDTPG
jgi:hypothetical protein